MTGAHAFAQAPNPAPAPVRRTANLNINPKRIIFDRLGRSAAIYVYNQGGGDGAFDVKLIDRIMLPNGQIVPVSEAEQKPELKPELARLKSAKDMLTATPRRVTLTGSTGQTIRVRASSLGAVPPGEYRTHLTVTALPPPEAGVTAEDAASAAKGALSFRIETVLGLSIPVIVRVGPVDVRAAIADAKIAVEDLARNPNDTPARGAVLSFDLIRAGANSLFGDLEIRGVRERGDREPLGVVRGVGVYPEIDSRQMKVNLRRVPTSGESLEIVFRDEDLSPGKILTRLVISAP